MIKSQKIRAFLAIPLTPEALTIINRSIKLLLTQKESAKVRWIHSNNFHLTIRFLGYCEKNILEKLIVSLENLFTWQPCFQLELVNVDFFPKYKPHVIAIHTKPNQLLTELNQTIEKIMIEHGFEPETRLYQPHLTIGRLKRAHPMPHLDFTHCKVNHIMPVTALHLYESHLDKTGAQYHLLHQFRLRSYLGS